MPKKPKAIVLDSWAVIAYLEDEPAAERVADIISDAHEQGIPLFMTVVNAGEVWYIVAREASASDAEASIKQLRDLGIKLAGEKLSKPTNNPPQPLWPASSTSSVEPAIVMVAWLYQRLPRCLSSRKSCLAQTVLPMMLSSKKTKRLPP